jgi:hypothetical protein
MIFKLIKRWSRQDNAPRPRRARILPAWLTWSGCLNEKRRPLNNFLAPPYESSAGDAVGLRDPVSFPAAGFFFKPLS